MANQKYEFTLGPQKENTTNFDAMYESARSIAIRWFNADKEDREITVVLSVKKNGYGHVSAKVLATYDPDKEE